MAKTWITSLHLVTDPKDRNSPIIPSTPTSLPADIASKPFTLPPAGELSATVLLLTEYEENLWTDLHSEYTIVDDRVGPCLRCGQEPYKAPPPLCIRPSGERDFVTVGDYATAMMDWLQSEEIVRHLCLGWGAVCHAFTTGWLYYDWAGEPEALSYKDLFNLDYNGNRYQNLRQQLEDIAVRNHNVDKEAVLTAVKNLRIVKSSISG
jgi:hypothetical protein